MDEHGALRALADPTRRAIFEIVAASDPLSVTGIAQRMPVSRPAVSQHLQVLAAAGLVTRQALGRQRLYRAEPAGLQQFQAWLDTQWNAVLASFGEAADEEGSAMNVTSRLAPVVKHRTVPLSPEAAFELFTTRMAEWWPTARFSIREQDVIDLRFEGQVGGRLVEIAADGTELSWADVLAWDPPHRVVLSWHPDEHPVAATRVEVRFSPVDQGTEVVLTHSGWEELGARAQEVTDNYDTGWDAVLAPFEELAGSAAW